MRFIHSIAAWLNQKSVQPKDAITIREEKLDDTLDHTFPASDAPSWTATYGGFAH